jgi:GxxExxY protein
MQPDHDCNLGWLRKEREKQAKQILLLEESVEKLKLRLKKKNEKLQEIETKRIAKAEKKNPTLPILSLLSKHDEHLEQILEHAHKIEKLALFVYNAFPYGAKEHHYQSLLEIELQQLGYRVQSEVAIVYKVNNMNGDEVQLPHDIRGREDLLLPNEKFILELKQTKHLGDSEHQQLLRYMHQRKTYSSWNLNTKGILINFGDEDFEMWLVLYDKDGKIVHIRINKTIPTIKQTNLKPNAVTL